MEQINILPYPIYKFQCNKKLLENVHNDVLSLYPNKFVNTPKGFQLSLNYFHSELFDFFDESLSQIQKKYLHDNITLPIVDCWVNRYPPLEKSREHFHTNSLVSGIFYLTTHTNEGATRFAQLHPWSTTENNNDFYNFMEVYKNPYKDYHEFFPVAGTLLLFPSTLLHYTTPCPKSKEIRYTIAFNAFPSGQISKLSTMGLTINTVSVRDKFGSKDDKR
jgi:uncharacterized protein (TIGR02466 family)